MVLRLFLLFTLLPLAELAILVWVHSVTNWPVTLAILFLPGVVGVWLVHREGLRCWREARRQLARGEMPAASVLDGLLILIAAVLLVTPGLLTDLAAIVLLIPPVRRAIRRYVSKRLQARISAALAKNRWLKPAAVDTGVSPGPPDGTSQTPAPPAPDGPQ